ncbi:MAG: methyltransferase domain-containing protein [Candidatus Margulisbacteria bacterium]|nr:methyltransferase domain-containing protein [Candidatus Margulisiibacteriota bacterium]
MDFAPPSSPHQKIARAYDKASEKYDNYVTGDNFLLKILKKIALGLDKEAEIECRNIIRKMLSQIREGTVLDIPAGTGLFTFEEYLKHPNILFIAAEYSWGMLKQAHKKIKELGAKNILLVRADVGNLPFKTACFDAVLCLNGIHSFPEKEKAITEMSRVLKNNKSLHGSLILRGERWLTDLILETAYYRLLWFTRPALSRKEFLEVLQRNRLKTSSLKLIKAAAAFEATKII